MSLDKILNESSILTHLVISIDGKEFIPEDVISMEIRNELDSFALSGSIQIKDTYDLFNAKVVQPNGNNLITLSISDFFEQKSIRTFRIIDTKTDKVNGRFKLINFDFVDELSFQLNNTYLSKSFNDTPIAAFQQYLTHLGIDQLLTKDKLVTDIVDTSTKQMFVVPQNISILEFFESKFKQDNIRIWQDRNGLNVKELSLVQQPLNIPTTANPVLYTNNITNNLYKYKIHEYSEYRNRTVLTNSNYPLSRTYRYVTDKLILSKTLNLVDEISNLKLNTEDMSAIQLNSIPRFDTQSTIGTKIQQFELFDTFMHNNSISCVVSGDIKTSNVGNIANTEFLGNILYSDDNVDTNSCGQYLIWGVTDRLVGDKLMQKLDLVRLDGRKS